MASQAEWAKSIDSARGCVNDIVGSGDASQATAVCATLAMMSWEVAKVGAELGRIADALEKIAKGPDEPVRPADVRQD